MSDTATLTPALTRAILWSVQFRLTPKEAEVAGLLIQGIKQAEIARRLHVGPRRVRVLVRNIVTKTGTSNAFHAALVLSCSTMEVHSS